VARLAEGNPLFVEELTAALADGVADEGLPVTVSAAIAARLDALPAPVRSVLLSASVVGRTFWRDAVATLSSGHDADVALDELERRDLVRREPESRLEGDVEYRFRHALIRDVAYATLPRAERATRHADVARYVEGRVGEDAGTIAWVLAHHWREAGEPARAVTHLLSAAAVAERGWATREVVDLYSLALELVDDPATRASIRLRRGIALKTLDADHEAAKELTEVLPELQGEELLDGLLYAGRAEIWCERHDDALRYAEQALAFAEELGDEDGSAAARALISNALAMRGDEGDIERALRVGDDALVAWRTGARRYEHADHLHLQADAKYWTGDYAACVDYAIEARGAAGDAHSAHALLRGGGIEAMARLGLGEFETALATLETHLTIGRELGYAAAFLANYRSAVFRELYDLDAARDASRAALETSQSSTFEMPRRFALSDLLQADLLAGDIGRAQAEWPALWADASEATGWTRWLIRGRLAVARAEIALHAETPEAAAEAATSAVDITVRTLRRKYEAEARSHLGRALVALGSHEEGVTELHAAVRLADALVNPFGRWRSRVALAAGLDRAGDDEGAAVATRDAQAILTEFAGSLAPERAVGFLATPPVRAVMEAAV
jgi:eukaryotic-like serine/threonine-protein kinase